MAKTSETTTTTASRRDFLKLTTAAAPVAVAVLALGAPIAEAAPSARADGLQDTAQTRAYYASARF